MHSRECIVQNSHIGSYSLNFLCIPQREGVIVSESYQNCIWFATFKVVSCKLPCHISAASVVVVPLLTSHQHRYCEETNYRYHNCLYGFVYFDFSNPLIKTINAQTYPYCKSIETSCVSIVSLSRLTRRLIEVKHNRQSCHEKKQENYECVLWLSSYLEYQSCNTQKKRQTEKTILSFVVCQVFGKVCLWS